jgi:hypothetical protein
MKVQLDAGAAPPFARFTRAKATESMIGTTGRASSWARSDEEVLRFHSNLCCGRPEGDALSVVQHQVALAHGGTLLSRDERSSAFATLHLNEVQEREEHSQLRNIARAALINWLLSDAE